MEKEIMEALESAKNDLSKISELVNGLSEKMQESNKTNSLLLMFIKNFIYSNNINKESLLTKHKMEKFFKLGLSISDVENSLNKKELSGCEKILLNLKNQEKEFLFKQLSLDLEKNDNKKKDKTKL